MSIETELKTFNEHFGRFIKTEEEKTAAISKLADAISQAVNSPAEMQMQPTPAPVLNEAKSAKVQPSIVTPAQPAPAPVEQKATPSEKVEPVTQAEVEKEPTEEMTKDARNKVIALCNRLKGVLGGKEKVKDFIKSFGHGDSAIALSYDLQLKFIDFASQKLSSLEAAHA